MHARWAILPVDTLSRYLSDYTLQAIDSDSRRSVYTYKCGCVAVRLVPAADCTVQWCLAHRRLTSAG